jgi:hypothetical protein
MGLWHPYHQCRARIFGQFDSEGERRLFDGL